jgi:hypothetical protein
MSIGLPVDYGYHQKKGAISEKWIYRRGIRKGFNGIVPEVALEIFPILKRKNEKK